MVQWSLMLLIDPFVIAGACAVTMLICLRVGYRRGSRLPEPRGHGSALIDESCMAILGLLLAFCFAAAYGKLDSRNQTIVADANAIRVLFARCKLLPEPERQKLEPLVLDSVRQRLAILRPDFGIAMLRELDAQARAGELEMLALVGRIGQVKETAEHAPALVDACCDVIAAHEARLSAGADQVPLPVIFLLVFVASSSSYLMGRSEAETGRLRRRALTLVFIVSAIVYVTLDIEQPLWGFIKANQTPILRLAESMGLKP